MSKLDCALDGAEIPCGECAACRLEALSIDEPIPYELTEQARDYLACLEASDDCQS